MNCRVLICLGLFVFFNWSCQSGVKDPRAEELEEVKVTLSGLDKEREVMENPPGFLESLPIDEGRVITALYPSYFNEIFDTESGELVGVDYVNDEFSGNDRHTIEEVIGYKLTDDKVLVFIHWSPVRGPGFQVTELAVIIDNSGAPEVIAGSNPDSRLLYGGGTILTDLPKPVIFNPVSRGKIIFGVSQTSRHAPSNSFNESIIVMEVNGSLIRQVFEYQAYSGHSSFRLSEEMGASQETLVEVGMMIPNHVFRTNIEQIESKVELIPAVTNGYNDIMLKEEIFQLSDDLKEIKHDTRETIFQYDGTAYVEDSGVSS